MHTHPHTNTPKHTHTPTITYAICACLALQSLAYIYLRMCASLELLCECVCMRVWVWMRAEYPFMATPFSQDPVTAPISPCGGCVQLSWRVDCVCILYTPFYVLWQYEIYCLLLSVAASTSAFSHQAAFQPSVAALSALTDWGKGVVRWEGKELEAGHCKSQRSQRTGHWF